MNLQQHKEAWEDFAKWYYLYDPNAPKGLALPNPEFLEFALSYTKRTFKSLPFEMQLGVYFRYLKEHNCLAVIGTFSEVCNLSEKVIEQAFKIRNEQLCQSQS